MSPSGAVRRNGIRQPHDAMVSSGSTALSATTASEAPRKPSRLRTSSQLTRTHGSSWVSTRRGTRRRYRIRRPPPGPGRRGRRRAAPAPDADGGVGRQEPDEQGGACHGQYDDGQRPLPADPVAERAEDERSQPAHAEGDGEERRRRAAPPSCRVTGRRRPRAWRRGRRRPPSRTSGRERRRSRPRRSCGDLPRTAVAPSTAAPTTASLWC